MKKVKRIAFLPLDSGCRSISYPVLSLSKPRWSANCFSSIWRVLFRLSCSPNPSAIYAGREGRCTYQWRKCCQILIRHGSLMRVGNDIPVNCAVLSLIVSCLFLCKELRDDQAVLQSFSPFKDDLV